MKGWRGTIGVLALAAALAMARPVEAGYLGDAGWGAMTVLSNIAYMPAKLIYATFGAATGGLAFALTGGDLETAETVWVTTLGGTYVVTPGMLKGEEPIAFAGTPGGDETETSSTTDTPSLDEEQLSGR